ncbi:hypothetical protein [Wenxinia marina]|uniref:SnoaL-like domain-containing protein n=1 Tax=Wenxinia marina DSM 24838 TaxID=1123501 RepID=A0A0D0Q1U6_9RHOB|nr:hypothetical protein [Wenxinia marina]KIQ68534.1 hypothetical protein Wenmar_02805 [Wenxinia marina DSM 24838]
MSSVRDQLFLDVQGFLTEIMHVVDRRDRAGYLDLIALPYVIITATDTRIFIDEDDMADHFTLFLAGLDTLGFEGVRHSLIRADALGRDLVSGIYETQLLGGTRVVAAPYRSTITIRRQTDRWRAVANAHTIGHADWIDRLGADDALHKK